MTTPTEAERMAALRQFMHNDGSGLVFGYDKEIIDRLLAALEKENAELRYALEKADIKAEAGLCQMTHGGCRAFHKDIRRIVAEALAGSQP